MTRGRKDGMIFFFVSLMFSWPISCFLLLYRALLLYTAFTSPFILLNRGCKIIVRNNQNGWGRIQDDLMPISAEWISSVSFWEQRRQMALCTWLKWRDLKWRHNLQMHGHGYGSQQETMETTRDQKQQERIKHSMISQWKLERGKGAT